MKEIKSNVQRPTEMATSPGLISRTSHRPVLITYSVRKWKGRSGPFYHVPPLTPTVYLGRH